MYEKHMNKALERLFQGAPLPTEPPDGEDERQTQGDDPETELQHVTTAEMIESHLARGHELQNLSAEDEIDRQRHLDKLRDEYIPKLYWLMIYWLGFVALCVVAVGMKWLFLSDPVLIALITTTTATVLGIFIIVAKWLFPAPPSKEK